MTSKEISQTAPGAPTPDKSGRRTGWVRSIDPQLLGLAVALGILVLIIGVQVPGKFFRISNLLNIGQAVTLIGLTGLASTVVIISGGLDISIGSIVGLCSAAALAMVTLDNAAFGIVAAVGIGLTAGMVNGLLITVGRINPVITTLGTLSAYRGIAWIMTGGYAVGVSNKAFNSIGSSEILGIPTPLVILIVVAVLFQIFLAYTDVGRNIFAMGGNPTAARLAGIGLNRYKLGIYMLSGLCAALAAIVLTARTNSGQPASGSAGLELEAITAAVLGGTAMSGGVGSVLGTMLGVLIIGTLNNGMILLNVPSFYQFVARGVLLIVAMLIQNWRTRGTQ
ncbi:MAG: ABC transporter permease [Anaerolineales bacterium]|nr:ABC transporter permease [Anaerolineales bacterium]